MKEQINKNIIDYRLDFAVNEIYEFFGINSVIFT